MTAQKFYSNGKLLITGEYLVLDGALALAVPTKYGQSLTIEPLDRPQLRWQSYDEHGRLWFEVDLDLKYGFPSIEKTDDLISNRLIQILQVAKKQNASFMEDAPGFKIKTALDFPRNWGLGTSSTLINNLAQWAKINPYQLLQDTFGGSGYDIACAMHNRPITYQLPKTEPVVIERVFNPDFKDNLHFVFLNKKQNSRDGIATYTKNKDHSLLAINEVSAITNGMLSCKSLEGFQFLMQNHERIIGEVIKTKPIQESLFKNFEGSIKSLGAWGGDFILVASDAMPHAYFNKRGYNVIIPYRDMFL